MKLNLRKKSRSSSASGVNSFPFCPRPLPHLTTMTTRDAIKTWLTSDTVKEKTPLAEARKAIESDMVRAESPAACLRMP
jgi:hypothetical protein